MTKKEYEAFKKNFHDFMEAEGLCNLCACHLECYFCGGRLVYRNHETICDDCARPDSEAPLEPHFSWRPCLICGAIAGNRYDASGYSEKDKCVKEYENVCSDCIYFSAYGQLDDMTMFDIEKEHAAFLEYVYGLTPLRRDTVPAIVADWLEEHGYDDEAEELRSRGV